MSETESNSLTRYDMTPWNSEGFMYVEATESPDGQWVSYEDHKKAVDALREQCAQIADSYLSIESDDYSNGQDDTAVSIATHIRNGTVL